MIAPRLVAFHWLTGEIKEPIAIHQFKSLCHEILALFGQIGRINLSGKIS